MNKHKLSILAFSVAILVASCRKNDVPANAEANSAINKILAPVKPEWATVAGWSSARQDKFTVNTGKIADPDLSEAVVSNGLVLVYKKNGSGLESLPFQEKGANDAYWYYQVSKGEIEITCDNYSGEQKLGENQFAYFVLNADKLADLGSKGYDEVKLLDLSYEQAKAILK